MIVAATDAIVSVDSSLNKTNRCLQSLDVLELSERKSEAVPVVEHTAIFSGDGQLQYPPTAVRQRPLQHLQQDFLC
ncbi:Uncharacterised protein [uncultured Ruminococcus sp.]|nr:Uncharacterised protein [uncultured Ruminococcus sp.]